MLTPVVLATLAAAAAPQRVALVPLTSLGAAEEEVEAIGRVLTAELQKILGDNLLDARAIRALGLEAAQGLGDCEGDIGCLTELAGALGLDAFIVGNIAGLGAGRVINLKIYDARTGDVLRATSEPADVEQDALVARMRKAAVQLVAPEAFTGTIELVSQQPGVSITIDGAIIGTTPLSQTRLPVAAGRHAVEASGEGFVGYSTLVEVGYGETRTVTIELAQSTAFVGGSTPFRHRWYTWAVLGAGLVGLGLGAYFNDLYVDGVRKVERQEAAGRLDFRGAESYQESREHWLRAKVFYGAGGALAAGATLLLAVDFL